MPRVRNWAGKLMLRSPGYLRSLRGVPLVGSFIHHFSHRILPDDERVWVQVEAGPASGLWMELSPRTGQTYLRGDGEQAVQRVLAERLRRGMVFYDLGANIGFYSMLAARIVGPGGRVFSFEPDSDVAGRLRRTVVQNQFENVTVVERAVWSSTCERKFVAADPSSPDHGTGTLMNSAESRSSTVVECVALDDFVQGAPPPQAIKCDVEGAEAEVLRGATNLLSTRRPWILCETHSEANGRACRHILRSFEYSLENIDGNHILATPRGD
jgi:FkbM family methyltransferase